MNDTHGYVTVGTGGRSGAPMKCQPCPAESKGNTCGSDDGQTRTCLAGFGCPVARDAFGILCCEACPTIWGVFKAINKINEIR